MASETQITPNQLARLVGPPDCPTLIDVRLDDDFAQDPQVLPSARRHAFGDMAGLARIGTTKTRSAPASAGLMAASLGLSRMYRDDLQQLEAGMMRYDAFYRWARDATDETREWPHAAPSKGARQDAPPAAPARRSAP